MEANMTPTEAAQYLGSLGGKANTARKAPAHADKLRVILAAARATRAKRLADAARIAAVCDTERGAMLAARRRLDDHAPRALARQQAAAESEPRTIHTDGRAVTRTAAEAERPEKGRKSSDGRPVTHTAGNPAPSTLEVTP
jgi:hypothetical protein